MKLLRGDTHVASSLPVSSPSLPVDGVPRLAIEPRITDRNENIRRISVPAHSLDPACVYVPVDLGISLARNGQSYRRAEHGCVTFSYLILMMRFVVHHPAFLFVQLLLVLKTDFLFVLSVLLKRERERALRVCRVAAQRVPSSVFEFPAVSFAPAF